MGAPLLRSAHQGEGSSRPLLNLQGQGGEACPGARFLAFDAELRSPGERPQRSTRQAGQSIPGRGECRDAGGTAMRRQIFRRKDERHILLAVSLLPRRLEDEAPSGDGARLGAPLIGRAGRRRPGNTRPLGSVALGLQLLLSEGAAGRTPPPTAAGAARRLERRGGKKLPPRLA